MTFYSVSRSRGFGFITYKDADSIDQAQANRPHKVDNREVDTKRAMPREVGTKKKKMHVHKKEQRVQTKGTPKEALRKCTPMQKMST